MAKEGQVILFFLLLIPLGLALAGLFFSNGRVTWKECLVHLGVVLLVIISGYYIALYNRSSDTEIWNGVVAEKHKYSHNCCHSYACDCRTICSGSGKSRSCRTTCNTCYSHGPRYSGTNGDVGWVAHSSNGEVVYRNNCNSPGTSEPGRYTQIRIGEPTAVEHGFTNYIKGNPDSILRRQGIANKFKSKLPDYPKVYDYYRANRFIPVGFTLPGQAALNLRLSEINGKLGAAKEINITIVVAKEADSSYADGLREHWYGGKKNDVIVVIGVPDYPRIEWASVLSWSKAENLKVDLRNRILDMQTFDGQKLLDVVEQETSSKFVRRDWSDFDYLKDTIEPTRFATWLLFFIGLILALGLQVYFWIEDPFGDGHESYSWSKRLRRW